MRYEGKLYRPPSEARSYILQATIGCSHNLCTYCDMYRDKKFRIRDLSSTLEDIDMAAVKMGRQIQKMFVADGDALAMPMDHWLPILDRAREKFPRLKQVSCYATATNLLEKTPEELALLRSRGLKLLYIGPESGDPQTLKRLVKGASREAHIEAAQRARAAGLAVSAIGLLGAGGVARSAEHAAATASLISAMDPEFFAALTLTVVPGTPMARMEEKGKFELPDVHRLLEELRVIVAESAPNDALFRTNHASNYLPIGGRLPRDRAQILSIIDSALSGDVRLKPEWMRGL